MSALRLQLLGGFCLRDITGAEIRIGARKGRALLAYAAFRAPEALSRDRLAGLLWEQADEELARTSLRQALAAVRKALPGDAQCALVADNDSIRLDMSRVHTDVVAFRESLNEGTPTALQRAAAHYAGELLDGFDARSVAFDQWVSSERLMLRRQIASVLQKLTDVCAAGDDIEGSLNACTRLVALDPLNEAAHRQLMQIHARRQAYGEALRHYHICRDILRRELDVAPEPATEALYRDCMRRRRAGTNMEEPAGELEAAPLPEEPAPPRAQARPELRDATILVTRLDGLLELEARGDPEESHALGANFEQRVRSVAEEFGGRADRRIGACVLSVFGIPSAHGNEPERAVKAAVRLRQQFDSDATMRNLQVQMRFGVAQGQVLQSAALFPVTGRPSHLAHVLASAAAPGQILLTNELHLALGQVVSAEAVTVSSSTEPIAAWVLRDMSAGGAAAARPFVGRHPELAMILAAFDRCMTSRHGRVIVIRGDPGIGKTRLVDAAAAAGRERNAAVHCAQVFDFGQSAARRPIAALAMSLLGLQADSPAADRAVAVQQSNDAMAGGVDQWIFLSDLVEAPLDPELSALERAMDSGTRQRGRSQALARLIEAAARTPLLLIAEDIHWADGDELARLAEIAAGAVNSRILVLLTTRPDGDPITATWRTRARGCPITTIDLAPLAADEAEELGSHFPGLSSESIAACVERAAGHPLFLDQLLRNASAGYSTLPSSIRTLVLARADRLTSQDHLALQAAAILGHRFDLAALRSVTAAEDLDPQPLIHAGLLRFDGVELQFAHALFRDAVYESTLRSQRRDLHLRAAEWFASADAALHADHLAAAQDDRATAAYLAAANLERDALHFERALILATRAKDLARDSAHLHATSLLIGELLLQLGQTHDALAIYRESLDFAMDSPGHSRAWFGIASALRVMDRHEEALEALDHAQASFGTDADPQTLARISTLRGNLCFPLGRIDACLQAHEQAHHYALQSRAPLEIAGALGGLGDAYYQRGQVLTARRHFAECCTQARTHGLVSVLLGNLPMLAISHTYCGDAPADLDIYAEALELARRIGDLRSQMLVHVGNATSLLIQAQDARSRASIEEAIELAGHLGARRFQAESLSVLALLLYRGSGADAALPTAREALRLGRETGMSYNGPALLGILAAITSDGAERHCLLAEGEALLAAGCVSHSYLEFYGNAIEVSLRTQAWSEARRYATALAVYMKDEPTSWTKLLCDRGRVLAASGEGATAAAIATDLTQLRNDCVRINALSLLPSIDAALEVSG